MDDFHCPELVPANGNEITLARPGGYAVETLGRVGQFRGLHRREMVSAIGFGELQAVTPVDKP